MCDCCFAVMISAVRIFILGTLTISPCKSAKQASILDPVAGLVMVVRGFCSFFLGLGRRCWSLYYCRWLVNHKTHYDWHLHSHCVSGHLKIGRCRGRFRCACRHDQHWHNSGLWYRQKSRFCLAQGRLRCRHWPDLSYQSKGQLKTYMLIKI